LQEKRYLSSIPSDRPRVDKRLLRLLSLVIFGLAVVMRIVPGPRTIDDSYITYRYARNLLEGVGFVFNPGERVLGTTTPLYTGLMVLGGILTGGEQAPFPQIAMVINALADGGVCLLLIHLGRRFRFSFAGWGAALAWAVAPFSVTFAIGGLETSVFVFLMTGAVAAHLEERHVPAACLGSLSILTRPDALILVGPLAIDRFWQWRQGRQNGNSKLSAILPEILIFTIPVAGWMIFASLYFGTPVPHSITAKSLAYQLSPDAGFVRLLQHFSTPFDEHLTLGLHWIPIGLVLYPFLYIIGAKWSLRSQPHAWPFIAYPWLYFASFALANPLIFRWYLTPPLPAYFLFILGGVEEMLSILISNWKNVLTNLRQKWRLRQFRLIKYQPHQERSLTKSILPRPGSLMATYLVIIPAMLAPTLLLLRDWRLHPDHGLDRPAPQMAWYQIELLYRQAAEVLIQETTHDKNKSQVLAAGDVGVLGYYTGMHILDTVGLNSPQSTRYYPTNPSFYVTNYAIPPQLILDTLPKYIVIPEVYGRAGLLKNPSFWQQYRLREKIPTDVYGSDGILILERIIP
jgi:hypothetical protein